ncbi:MAG: hypothetical protein JSV93_04460, partial [Candidatus Omnitrophota bacterium]
IVSAKRAYRVEHGTYQGIPPYPYAQCRAGDEIPAGSTLVQQDLGIQVDEDSFFQYLIYPSSEYTGATTIFFKKLPYDWAWYYNYATKTWYEYALGDGGPAREYFTPPS